MKAIDISWTRDPVDRVMVAATSILNIPLVTKDQLILKNFSLAVW
ncbi:MAG: hypothetical protein Q8R79_00495 [Legionellaceae bacterium]|nr:hypothetical protein [Legionellaceae bacterium]